MVRPSGAFPSSGRVPRPAGDRSRRLSRVLACAGCESQGSCCVPWRPSRSPARRRPRAQGAAPPAADRSGRTGNLIALVRSPRILAPAGEASRKARLDAARGRISAVLDRSGLPRVRSIPELGAVAVRPAPGQGLARARRELEADPGGEAGRAGALQDPPLPAGRSRPDERGTPALRRTTSTSGTCARSGSARPGSASREGARSSPSSTRESTASTSIWRGGSSIRRATTTPVAAASSQPECTGPEYDEVGHGTHVAGLACAGGQQRPGVSRAPPSSAGW